MVPETEEVEPWLWLVISKGRSDFSITMNRQKQEDIIVILTRTINMTLSLKMKMLWARCLRFRKGSFDESYSFIGAAQQELIRDVYVKDISMAEIAREWCL